MGIPVSSSKPISNENYSYPVSDKVLAAIATIFAVSLASFAIVSKYYPTHLYYAQASMGCMATCAITGTLFLALLVINSCCGKRIEIRNEVEVAPNFSEAVAQEEVDNSTEALTEEQPTSKPSEQSDKPSVVDLLNRKKPSHAGDKPITIKVEETDHNGQTELHRAVQYCKNEEVQDLIDSKAALNLQDKNRKTPLHIAAQKGFKKICSMLISAKANVDLPDINGQTPLHIASSRGHKNIVEQLLEAKASTKTKDDKGNSPLKLALIYNHNEVAKVLVSHGADVEEKDENGDTLLWQAVEKKLTYTENLIPLLLELGANANVKKRNSLLYHAVFKRRSDPTIEQLIESGAEVDSETLDLAKKRELDTTIKNAILKKKSKENLHAAAEKGDLDNIKRLFLSHDLNQKDDQDRTPLHCALQHHKFQAALVLISAGAEIGESVVHFTTKKGQNLLHFAAMHNEIGVAKKLLEANISPLEKDKNGKSPFEIARIKGNLELQKEFLRVMDIEPFLKLQQLLMLKFQGQEIAEVIMRCSSTEEIRGYPSLIEQLEKDEEVYILELLE